MFQNLLICTILLFAAPATKGFAPRNIPGILKPRTPALLASSSLKSSTSSSSSDTGTAPDTSANKKREPWDFIRFVRQSSKFVSLPKQQTEPTQIEPGDVLWSSSSSSLFTWGPLDDVVMGGVSSSTFNNDNGKWSGFVTDKNSGGFVGIRTTPFKRPLDMSPCKGVVFTLKGTGSKQFKAVVRDSTNFNGVCWTGTFGGASKWGLWSKSSSNDKEIKVKIPFETLIPTIFAKTVPNQVLKQDNVVGFQLVYSKFLYDGDLNPDFLVGDFDLDVIEIKAY